MVILKYGNTQRIFKKRRPKVRCPECAYCKSKNKTIVRQYEFLESALIRIFDFFYCLI